MCGKSIRSTARPTCGAAMAWPHGSAVSRRRDDGRAYATGPSRRGATAAAATGLDAARSRRACDVRCVDGVAPRLRGVSEARRRPCPSDWTFATRSDAIAATDCSVTFRSTQVLL